MGQVARERALDAFTTEFGPEFLDRERLTDQNLWAVVDQSVGIDELNSDLRLFVVLENTATGNQVTLMREEILMSSTDGPEDTFQSLLESLYTSDEDGCYEDEEMSTIINRMQRAGLLTEQVAARLRVDNGLVEDGDAD